MAHPDETEIVGSGGGERPSAPPQWRRTMAAVRILALLRAAAERELVDQRAAAAELDKLIADHADDPQIQVLAASTQATMVLNGGIVRDPGALHAALVNLGEMVADHPETAPMLELMAQHRIAIQAHQAGDSTAALSMLTDLIAKSGELPEGNLLRSAFEEIAPMVQELRVQIGGAHEADSAARDQRFTTIRNRAERLDLPAAERAFLLVSGGGLALGAGAEQDPARIDAAIDDLREAITLTPDDHPDHVIHLASLAGALSRRAQVSGALEDVDEAITILEQARVLAGTPGHPHWSLVHEMLAGLRSRRGDALPARLAALEGLRGYVWQVLLQPDASAARAIARTAADDAMSTARRCLVDHAPVDALRALDAGRGLMLFAAIELRDPYTRLIDAGQADLARRWRATEHPSTHLREDVLQVLSEGVDLLDPPDLSEIQHALRRLDADALVYLVPADFPSPGWAVIAPAEGPPRYVALPHLAIEQGSDIERYLAAMATRDAALVEPGADRKAGPGADREIGSSTTARFVDSLDALCGWAWKAAMKPLVEPYLVAPSAGVPDRVPRLILVPMGDLARVPWQAARSPDGLHLVQRVAISQAVSARMLCDSAAAEPVQLTSSGLVLADPDTGGRAADLLSARLEAYAIHQVFYPGATYVGRRPDGSVSRSGAGTAGDVRSWLRADSTPMGSMLHLASHGVVETATKTASSRLLLAGGDLTADELLGVMSASARHQLGLVVLAACHTGRSIYGYDEAYSLGTMFLASGARSVLSTQWSIPDRDTSLLMYMFHHFLVVEGRPPWDALRRAQVWMLDADREPPRHMPLPLRRTLDDTDPAHMVAWAGFVHWGQ
ncbi:CHAT domain-containing protein [Micromonospora sp. NBC_01813]|uniref:CHAT domain-containing protein n=1 Tax=Micromonospora sp. NBC_01813 TaxID=2975988 RepID=UPI002DD9F44C|nr:CHAT domain-containing protein [Micromonospora sp. NBC_01813]WSA07379.1 CHAT domain-containing protein [Micromonospora sp. NBC_01813]